MLPHGIVSIWRRYLPDRGLAKAFSRALNGTEINLK